MTGDLAMIAQYGSRFAADGAVAVLASEDIAAFVPEEASSTHTPLVTRVFHVGVAAADADQAREVLRAHGASPDELGEAEHEALQWRGPAVTVVALLAFLALLAAGTTRSVGPRLGFLVAFVALVAAIALILARRPRD